MTSGRREAGDIRFLVNAKDLYTECTRIFRETLLVPVLTYGSEIMLCKEKKRYKITADRQIQSFVWY